MKFFRELLDTLKSRPNFKNLKVLSSHDIIENSNLSTYFLKILIITCILISVGIIWVAISEVDDIKSIESIVLPKSSYPIVMRESNSVVKSINFAEGETVERNQVLIEFSDKDLKSKLRNKKNTLSILDSEISALQKYNVNKDFELLNEYYANKSYKQFNEIALLKIETFTTKKNALIERKKQYQSKAKILSNSIEKEQRNIEVIKSEISKLNSADTYKYSTQQELNKARNNLNKLISSKNDLTNVKVDLNTQLMSLEKNFIKFINYRLSELNNKKLETKEKIVDLESKISNLIVKSPLDGTVANVNIYQGKNVVLDEKMLEIIPNNTDIILEAKLDPNYLTTIDIGQEVYINIFGSKQKNIKPITGKINFISPTTYFDNDSNPFYKVRVKIISSLEDNSSPVLYPGMKVDTRIYIGKKSVIDYLLGR